MSELEQPSALEQALSLRKQAEELLREARMQSLSQARKAVADLNALGFSFKLLESDKPVDLPMDRFHYRVVDINKSQSSTRIDTAVKMAQMLSNEHPGREFIVEKVERVWPHA